LRNSTTGVLTKILTNSFMVALSCAVASLAPAPAGEQSVSKTNNINGNLLKNNILIPIVLKIV
jgi:hypothetical protein